MRAICWRGKEDMRVDDVPGPQIQDAKDAIIRITSTDTFHEEVGDRPRK